MSDQTAIDPGRREALRKLLAGAAVASAAPVVSTFFAPAGAALTSQAINRFLLSRTGSGANALTDGVLTLQNTDAAGLGCIPAGWSTGTDTTSGDGAIGTVETIATDRDNDGDFTDPGTTPHITTMNNPDTPAYGTSTQVLARNTRVTFRVILPAGCRFDTATGFPTAATAQVRAEMRRDSAGGGTLDPIEGDDSTAFSAVQCAAGTIGNIANGGRTADITATFVERRVYDNDSPLGNDWATYKVNNVQVRIAAYCNL